MVTPPRAALRRVGHDAFRRSAAARTAVRMHPPIEDDVLRWAQHRGLPTTTVYPSRRTMWQLPRTIEPETYPRFARRVVADHREGYLVALRGARMLGPRGLVVLPDGRFAAESLFDRSHVVSDPWYVLPRRRRVVARSGDFFSLIVKFAVDDNNNYYHWLHDTLERLYGLRGHLPEGTRFLVPPGLGQVHLDALRALGVRDEQVEVFTGEEVWELETLHFVPPATPPGQDRTDVDEWLRDTVVEALGVRVGAPSRRLFLSRRLTERRHLVNEPEVEEHLRARGFETWSPETLSFREQVELFAQAEAVVATHGAALTNILFAPSGLNVVDMVQPDMLPWSPVFWSMSEALGHRYSYFVADPVPRPGQLADTSVPIEKLAATLDRLPIR